MPHAAAAVPTHRYVALDSLRGVCACMVVLLHFISQGYIGSLPLVRHGFLFVDFFFVLSGFVIGSSYGDRLAQGFSISRFMLLRLGRVYPLHLVVLLVFLGFEVVFAIFLPGLASRQPFAGDFSLATFLQSLLLVQIFFGPDGTPWNGPSWSIAAEIWTYLTFALLLRHVGRWLFPICLAIAFAAATILALRTDRYINVFHDGAFVRCLFGFALGIMGWRVADKVMRVILPRWADTFVELAVVAVTIALVTAAGAGPLSLAAPCVFLAAVLVFSRERGVVSALLRRGPFVLVGTLSYSIYMIHGFLYYRLLNGLALGRKFTGLDLVVQTDGHNSVGGGALFGDLLSICFLALVVGCSYLSYISIERPGQNFARDLVRKRAASSSPPSVGAP